MAKTFRSDAPILWKEVSEERYWEILGALPPRIQLGHGFLAGEPTRHRSCGVTGLVEPTYMAFVEHGGRHYEAWTDLSVAEFRAVRPAAITPTPILELPIGRPVLRDSRVMRGRNGDWMTRDPNGWTVGSCLAITAAAKPAADHRPRDPGTDDGVGFQV